MTLILVYALIVLPEMIDLINIIKINEFESEKNNCF